MRCLTISLEVDVNREHSIRKRFQKEAEKHYRKEVFDKGYFKTLRNIGIAFSVGGTALMYFLESPWFLIPAGAGAFNIAQSYIKSRSTAKIFADTLQSRTSHVEIKLIKERMQNNDYTLPLPSKEEKQNIEMEYYASDVANSVAEKEYGFWRYPWPIAATGLMGVGIYKGFSDEPLGGSITLAIGGIALLATHHYKKHKLKTIAEKTHEFLKIKGFDYFKKYIENKEHYEFFKDREDEIMD